MWCVSKKGKRRAWKEKEKSLPLKDLLLDELPDLGVIQPQLALGRHALNAEVTLLRHLAGRKVLIAIDAVPVAARQGVSLHLGLGHAADIAGELLGLLDSLITSNYQREKTDMKRKKKKEGFRVRSPEQSQKEKVFYPCSIVAPTFLSTASESSIYLSMSFSCFHLYERSRMAATGSETPRTP